MYSLHCKDFIDCTLSNRSTRRDLEHFCRMEARAKLGWQVRRLGARDPAVWWMLGGGRSVGGGW